MKSSFYLEKIELKKWEINFHYETPSAQLIQNLSCQFSIWLAVVVPFSIACGVLAYIFISHFKT